MAKKERIDKLLVDQGLAKSRTQAQALIMAGHVCLGDRLVLKASEKFETRLIFRLKEGAVSRFVSRGGEKLQGVLSDLRLSVKGLIALDIGISTGGFTDCLLQNGVTHVTGLDVGHNQLDWKIKNDPRVKAFEGINARQIPSGLISEPVDIVVIDVSFISLTLIVGEALRFLKPKGLILALIKPQFEVNKGRVGKGGVVKDPLLHKQVQDKIWALCEKLGLTELKIVESPLEGTDGNKEFFISGLNHHSAGPAGL